MFRCADRKSHDAAVLLADWGCVAHRYGHHLGYIISSRINDIEVITIRRINAARTHDSGDNFEALLQ